MKRIGIDVGGTHTDAVLLEGDAVIATTKALTSADVLTGIMTALEALIDDAAFEPADIEAVMLGTTQFTNAVVERRELTEVAAIRIGMPSGDGLPLVRACREVQVIISSHHHRFIMSVNRSEIDIPIVGKHL